MRHASLASRVPVVHVLVGLAIFVQADVPAPERPLRRLQAPTALPASVKSFYNGLSGAPPVVTTPVLSTTNGYQAIGNQAGGVTTTADFPLLQGVSDRNKAIITGVAAGAGLSAVAGGIAIAVQALVKKKEKPKPELARKQARSTLPPTTTIATTPTTTTTTAAGDEIPMPVWIILGVLCSCCVLTLVAALATQFSRRDRKSSSRKKRSATLQRREPSRDSAESFNSAYSHHDQENSSMYSTYSEYPSSEYSVYPSEYSQANMAYEQLPTGEIRALSMIPDIHPDIQSRHSSRHSFSQPAMASQTTDGYTGYLSPYIMTEPWTSINAADPYTANAGNWQARPSSFDPYSYANEDPYMSNSGRGVSFEAQQQALAAYASTHGGSAHAYTSTHDGSTHGGSGHRQRSVQFNEAPQTRGSVQYNDAPQTRGNPHLVAPSYSRNDLYPEEIYSGYV